MSKMPCMNDGTVTFVNFGGLTLFMDKKYICGRGGKFPVEFPIPLGRIIIDPRRKLATDCHGRTTPIFCKLLKGDPDDFGVEVAIGNPRLPPSQNLNAFETKVYNFGV